MVNVDLFKIYEELQALKSCLELIRGEEERRDGGFRMQLEGLNSIQDTVCLNCLRGQIVFKMSN